MIRVVVIWFPLRPGKAEQATEVVPSSVTFSKPQAVGKSESMLSSMSDDLGPAGPRRRQNADRRFREGRR